jgi:hypothetical protein
LERGNYLVLLNTDFMVTDGWLGQLVALVNANMDFTATETATIGVNAEDADRKAENRDAGLAIVGAEIAESSMRRLRAHPPWPPLHKGRTTHVRTVIVLLCHSLNWGTRPTDPIGPIDGSDSLGRCRIMQRRRSWLKRCPIATSTRCVNLPGGGSITIEGSGSPCPAQ